MLHVRIGPAKMSRPSILRFWKFFAVALSVVCLSTFLLKYSDVFSALTDKTTETETLKIQSKPLGPCPTTVCEDGHFSFYIQSGAAAAVAPKICFRNQLVLGAVKNNAGVGINVVVISGKTGEILNTGNYDMYAGDVKDLIEFLKVIETGSIVLMASFDDPSTKLNEEARALILGMGSSSIKTVGFRDNWVFVGGKGAHVQTTFEKHSKHSQVNNLFNGWPDIIDISGCIPKYLA